MKVCAIIQARMGSTRLPGKVLLPLAGKSMLQNIVERVFRAKLVDGVVVSVPKKDASALSGDWAMHTYCGDESDLIGRYYAAAKMYEADLVVRICSDNPCIEPSEIDRAIELRQMTSFPGLVSNAGDFFYSFYPDGIGCEVYKLFQLKRMNALIKDPLQREHPHRFFHERNTVIETDCPLDFYRPRLKLDVNTKKQYKYIKDIYDHFGHNEFHITEVINYLDEKK